jgi:Tectonin domain
MKTSTWARLSAFAAWTTVSTLAWAQSGIDTEVKVQTPKVITQTTVAPSAVASTPASAADASTKPGTVLPTVSKELTVSTPMVITFDPTMPTLKWALMRSSAVDVAVGHEGSVYVLRGAKGADGWGLERWDRGQNKWPTASGRLVRVAVGNDGELWGVNAQNQVFRRPNSDAPWQPVAGTAIDVSARAETWAVGANQQIYRFNKTTWDTFPGVAVRVVAGAAAGQVYAINANGESWMRTSATQTLWQKMDGAVLQDITVDGNGRAWGVTRTPDPASRGDFTLVSAGPGKSTWVAVPGAATKLSAGQNELWSVNARGEVFKTALVLPTPGSNLSLSTPGQVSLVGNNLQSQQPESFIQVGPAPADGYYFEHAAAMAFKGGTTLCSEATCADPNIKPYYVGPYALNMNCGTAGSGYNNGNLNYAAIDGGTCWKCPENDNAGNPWNWDLSQAGQEGACWRVPFEQFGPAQWVKSGLDWDCDKSAGEFWDMHNASGALSGSCWKCSDPQKPRRTQFQVQGPQACATPVRQAVAATLWKYNGCPAVVPANMNLPGKMLPGRPYLDISRGWSEGQSSGACYACPASDADGNMVATGTNQCNLVFKWQPTPLPAPGLSGLDRVGKGQTNIVDLLNERKLFSDHKTVSGLLYAYALTKGMDANAATAYVQTEWPKLAAAPYQSPALRAAVHVMLLDVAQKRASQRTKAEAKAYDALAIYMTTRRQWVANQAYNMYKAWHKQAYADYAKSGKAKNNRFFYGLLPLDFNNIFASAMTPAAVGLGVAGAVGAQQAMLAAQTTTTVLQGTEKAVQVLDKSSTLFGAFNSASTAMQNLSFVGSAVSGATVITTVGGILLSIALDQFMTIQMAEPKLQAAIAAAERRLDVSALAVTPAGLNQIKLDWTLAMETTERENPTVVAAMQTLYQRAQAANFALK